MILGISTATFTLAHVIISLIEPQSVCLPTGGVANVLQVARKDHHGEGAKKTRVVASRKCTPRAPCFTRATFPVMHLISPMCFLASSGGRQSPHARAPSNRDALETWYWMNGGMVVRLARYKSSWIVRWGVADQRSGHQRNTGLSQNGSWH